MMFVDYKHAVSFNYRKKKTEGLLSSNLSNPTPGKLKKEVLLLLNSRSQIKDEKIIKDFFNSGTTLDNYGLNVRRFDVDKLKPLNNFLKDSIQDTGDKNIELLAWLIDFEPRPYDYKTDYTLKEESGEPEDTDEHGPIDPEDIKIEIKPITKYVIGILTLVVVFGSGSFLAVSNDKYEHTTKAYICTSKVAKKYHLDPKCHGLNNCKREITETSIAEAKKANRTLCEIER